MARKWKAKGSLWFQPSLLPGLGNAQPKKRVLKEKKESYKLGDYKHRQPPLMLARASTRVRSRHTDRLRRVV